MAKSYQVRRRWIENFGKCPLVDKQAKSFDHSMASQLFYGKKDDSYPEKFPNGFEAFYNNSWQLEKDEIVETVLVYLRFIGVRVRAEAVSSHLESFPSELHKLTKKTYFILRTLAHGKNLDISNPFKDNPGDLDFLARIETGQAQLSIFESDLPAIYGRNASIPEGYGENPIIQDLFNKIENSSQSYFVTGKAGTGKSTFIQYFAQTTKKTVLLTAFTGIAAINVGGVTVHSFFRFPIRPLLPGDEEIKKFHENDQRRKIITETDTIIIDEVSMLRADVLQAIDHSLRQNGGNAEKLFGGKQIIFVGDIFQLPPVSREGDEVEKFLFEEVYNSPYFFDCDAYKELQPAFFEFTKSYRQKEDLEFVELLDKVRSCSADVGTLEKLNQRVDVSYQPKPGDFAITLTTSNYIANQVNNTRLSELPTTRYEFGADIKGDFEDAQGPTHKFLELKKDAQVIFIRNDISGERRWVNGTIGKIEFVAHDIVEVRLPDGKVHKLEKETWENRGYKYDRAAGKVVSEVKGAFTQYPIKLAWAITIHKSQGLTFDDVIIDLGSGAFVNGQLYTALSRCRRLDGIVLRKKIRPDDIIQDRKLMEFYDGCLKQIRQ
jgi:ATP-dependent DNA helicase PIF1